MTKKSDAATIDRRVDHIVELILAGKSTSNIMRDVSVKRWNITTRQVSSYIARAREEIRARGEFDKVDEFGKAIARREAVYREAMTKGDLATARAVIADICKQFGIDGPIHVKVEGSVAVTTFAELARRAAQAAEEHDADA